MKKLLETYRNYNFDSSSHETKEFSAFARKLKAALNKELKANNLILAKFNKGHFEVSAFIENMQTKKQAYVRIGDVRYNDWSNDVLYRTVENLSDYTGGHNRFTTLEKLGESLANITQ